MAERQSSGLVKKGKFVKRMLEIMNDGVIRSFEAIWADGHGEIGPSQDYVKANLDKLVASSEVILEDGAYHLPRPLGRTAPVREQEASEQAPMPVLAPVREQKLVVTMIGDKLARNIAFEDFLSCSFLNEIPGWEKAVDYYCATHGAKYSIVNFKGRLAGERIVFE